MFNNKEMTNSTNGSGQSPSLNMISEGTKLKGDFNSQNDIRISGRVEGEVATKGKLIITSSGRIEGNIKVKEADIAGKLEGEIRVTNRLVVRQTAIIDGNIFTKSLLVEEGAQINGSCKMEADATNLSGHSDTDFAKATRIKSGPES